MTSPEMEAAQLIALSDPTSEYYRKITAMLDASTAAHARVKSSSPYVTIPFNVSSANVAALEEQFAVQIRLRCSANRLQLTERVSALIHVLDSALMEHAGGRNRRVLLIDGDAATVAAIGNEFKMVERTYCHARAAVGYFHEYEALHRMAMVNASPVRTAAATMLMEITKLGGAHYHPSVRSEGPSFDSVVINHFRTPVGLAQAAWLAVCRGGIGYGAIPFQLDFRQRDKGRLLCFPGWFYVDRANDVITLVPDEDASMSISHPYSMLMEFVDNNGIKVSGTEVLCEKYMSVKGILYYSLAPVRKEYDIPESLRAYHYDTDGARMSVISYPKVKLSDAGTPVGFERAQVRLPTSRLQKLMGRVMTSRSPVVTPAEVYVALVDYNNMTVNTLDSAATSERLDEFEQEAIALAVALHVNWRRKAAYGTLTVLLNAIRGRHEASGASIMNLSCLALSAWWQRPEIVDSFKTGVIEQNDAIPTAKISDWCGTDFSVMVNQIDPWLEIVQDVSRVDSGNFQQVSWFPSVPGGGPGWRGFVSGVVESVVSTARDYFPASVPSVSVEEESEFEGPTHIIEDESWENVQRSSGFGEAKSKLGDKMRREQYAVNEQQFSRTSVRLGSGNSEQIPVTSVPDVEPISTIRADLDMVLGGLPARDMAQTGHRLAEVESDKITSGNIAINDSKRVIPKEIYVRDAKVDAGVEGSRVASAASLLGAVYKRNVGIPPNRGAVDLDTMPGQVVDRVIATCFRSDWQEIVNRHLESGMWQPNEQDIEGFLEKADEAKAESMLGEFFMESYISLDRWKLMAKGKIKPSREVGFEAKVDHSQTIMFLESKNTNGMYSAITRRVNACIAECLIPNIRLNAQCGVDEDERWLNEMESARRTANRVYNYIVDSKAFDRSQEHPALLTEITFLKRLGLNGDTYEIWKSTHGKKKAMSMAYGVVFTIVLCGISGYWKTLLRNGLIQLSAMVVSTGITRRDIVSLEIKGDDVDAEFSRPIEVETAVERMSLSFNLATKFSTADVRYFCKAFRIKVVGRWVVVADPWVKIQSVCAPIKLGGPNVDMHERWISLCADLHHYDNETVLQAVAEATKILYGMERPPLGMCFALAKLKADKNVFMGFYDPIRKIS